MEDTKEENITNENIRSIHQLVKLVKQDEEVSLEYMKIFEREQMLIEQGIQQGIQQAQAALEQERLRADQERQRAENAEREVERLKAALEKASK